MPKKIKMTDSSIKYESYLHLDSIVQTIDLTAFHRLERYTKTQTDKKENSICRRFAFLKISKKRFFAHLHVAALGGWASPTTCKRANLFTWYILIASI